ncbi:IS5 family transposase [Flammeovirga kamogawensis]|uniref:IS5 family transposase n=1 Tax=Flammeovirga kamogawensis TaxID=373891 RepID=UPI0021D19CC8|nr:IS5 family transposase [Flammeovirga kamogawensis]
MDQKKLCLRSVIDAILWITRTGCQWRNLDSQYHKWESVYHYFRKWKNDGTIELINLKLATNDRLYSGRKRSPSLLAIDSQSVKLSPFLNIERGIDGHKKINGCKRHIIVDSEGRFLGIHIGPANQHDGAGGVELLPKIALISERLEIIKEDKAYGGLFKKNADLYGFPVETKQRPPSKEKGFIPEFKRWQVERSFGWLNFFRRLSKDYERLPKSHMCFIYLASITMLINKT